MQHINQVNFQKVYFLASHTNPYPFGYTKSAQVRSIGIKTPLPAQWSRAVRFLPPSRPNKRSFNCNYLNMVLFYVINYIL